MPYNTETKNMEMYKKIYLVPVLQYTCCEYFLETGSEVESFVKYHLWH